MFLRRDKSGSSRRKRSESFRRADAVYRHQRYPSRTTIEGDNRGNRVISQRPSSMVICKTERISAAAPQQAAAMVSGEEEGIRSLAVFMCFPPCVFLLMFFCPNKAGCVFCAAGVGLWQDEGIQIRRPAFEGKNLPRPLVQRLKLGGLGQQGKARLCLPQNFAAPFVHAEHPDIGRRVPAALRRGRLRGRRGCRERPTKPAFAAG